MFRYYTLTDVAPVHYAAVALNPEMKFDYFETEWKDRKDWVQNAEKEVQNLWQTEYKNTSQEANNFELPLRHNNNLQPTIAQPYRIGISPPKSLAHTPLTQSDYGDLPSWKKNKRARIAADKLDPYDRFIQKEVEDELPTGPLQYWLDRRSERNQEELATMGVEIFSIPAMSADPERPFSRYPAAFFRFYYKYTTNMEDLFI